EVLENWRSKPACAAILCARPCPLPSPMPAYHSRKGFMMLRTLSLAAVALSLTLEPAQAEAPKSAAVQSLSVYPAKVHLTGPRAEQHLGVLGEYVDRQMRELTRSARFTSSDAMVVSVDAAGLLRGLTNGKATVTVEADGKRVLVPVVVEGADDEAPVSFSREVVPV